MYRLRGFFILLSLSIAIRDLPAQVVLDLPVPSQHARVAQTVGLTEVTVEYSRPAVKGRKIWGGLVPLGFRSPGPGGRTAPWRTGANLNTVLSVEHDVKVEGQPVRAGRYGLFMDIGEDSSATVILSRAADSWGSFFYEPAGDALRVVVKPRSHAHTELLTFSFDDVQPQSAVLTMRWERMEVPIRFDANVDSIAVASIRAQFRKPVAFSYHSRLQAAAYLAAVNAQLPVALQWANEAIEGVSVIPGFPGHPDFVTYTTRADILYLMDSVASSRRDVQSALRSIDEDSPPGVVNLYGRSLIPPRRLDDATAVAAEMKRRWPTNWTPDDLMAHALSAQGKYGEALRFERLAFDLAPPAARPAITARISLLQAGKDINN